jgi:hypothetical protein
MASQRALNRIYKHQKNILNKHTRERAQEIEARKEAIKLVNEKIYNYDELILQIELQKEPLRHLENELTQLNDEQRIINEKIRIKRVVVTNLQMNNTSLNNELNELITKRNILIEQRDKLTKELVKFTCLQ